MSCLLICFQSRGYKCIDSQTYDKIKIKMVDLKKLKAFYNFSKELSFKDIQVFVNATKQEKFEPTEFLIKEGSLKSNVYFLQSGLVRSFIIDDKGDEITMSLMREHQIVVSLDNILHNQASRYFFQALEPTVVLTINYELMEKIVSQSPKLEKSRQFIFQKVVKEAYIRIESFVLYSPEERYLKYIKTNPDINERVPNKYLANVLGITPVSLSRIRKRIAEKKK